MCVQEEDRLKAQNGGSLNYVKDNKKMTFTQSNNSSPSKPYAASSSVPEQANPSEQRSVSSLSEDWALQERLPCFSERINGKER